MSSRDQTTSKEHKTKSNNYAMNTHGHARALPVTGTPAHQIRSPVACSTHYALHKKLVCQLTTTRAIGGYHFRIR